MAETSSLKRDFEPDGIPTTTSSSEAQAPALSSSKALARFEFEPGRSNEATKILMVEWEDDTESGTSPGDWEVSWDGKKTTLSARDGAEGSLHRIYFLLGPGVSIPPVVKLAQAGGKVIQTNPLPAIFPAELGASATAAGKLGVLHTVWAKKRLSVLQKEIELEMKINGEGIGLEMAMQEKQWIEDNFGVGSRAVPEPQHPKSPTSPKTPGGGRLSEKLKGLKLGTSASALSAPLIGMTPLLYNYRKLTTKQLKSLRAREIAHFLQTWETSQYLHSHSSIARRLVRLLHELLRKILQITFLPDRPTPEVEAVSTLWMQLQAVMLQPGRTTI